MYRKITQALGQWRTSAYRKPLILQGARQVGKTYSVLEFGRSHYENVAYFNFETDPAALKLFEGNISPETLVPALSYLSGQTIVREKTLIIFDEVQLGERALTSLKYFCEQAPEYHIIACGSLLGVAVNRKQYAFPVGKVDFLTMYPMDLEEFLLALGDAYLVEQIKAHFADDTPMPQPLHEAALARYRQYLIVGGMPEAVKQFAETGDYYLIRNTQNAILTSYLNDMSKYNEPNDIKKTHLTYNSITAQLSQKNTRFRYKLVKSGGRAAAFENAIEWLVLSGVVLRLFAADQMKRPLANYVNIDDFKIYMSDSGLLTAKYQVRADDILFMSDGLNDFKGGMTENYVQTQLVAAGYTTYYWHAESSLEIDFLIEREGDIIPIEVKAGDNTRSRSLNTYIKRFQPAYAVRLSTKNFGFEDGKKSVPLYAAFCL